MKELDDTILMPLNSFSVRRWLSPVMTNLALDSIAQSKNMLSSGSSLITEKFCCGFTTSKFLLLVRINKRSLHWALVRLKRPITSRYSKRIGLETHRIIFSSFHRSIIFFGFPPHRLEIRTLVSKTTLCNHVSLFLTQCFPIFIQFFP